MPSAPIRASDSPITSWIHTTSTGKSSGADSAFTAGDEPTVAMSRESPPKPCTTSAPEAYWVQRMSALGMQVSSTC